MVQDFTEDTYDPDHVADTDLGNMEDCFLTLKSMFSGGSSPSNPVAGMPWFDTAKKNMKFRNQANSAWLGLLSGDASQKIPVYRDDTMDGWLIDSGISDCVIALKGGGEAYGVAAGPPVVGSWTQPNHTLITSEMPEHTHPAVGNHAHALRDYVGGGGTRVIDNITVGTYGTFTSPCEGAGGHSHPATGGNGSHNHGLTYRPRAALCTLQYLDL